MGFTDPVFLTSEQVAQIADAIIDAEPRFKNSTLGRLAKTVATQDAIDTTVSWTPPPLCIEQFRDLAGFMR